MSPSTPITERNKHIFYPRIAQINADFLNLGTFFHKVFSKVSVNLCAFSVYSV